MAVCKIHSCKFIINDGKEMCPFGHEREKLFCLVRIENSGPGWSDWYYSWIAEDEAEGKEIIETIPEDIYKRIKRYKNV